MNNTELEYTPEEREYLRSLFDAWKAEHLGAVSKGAPLMSSPAFRSGLDSLINEHGYCQSDIARWFGVSRERVRQWCEMCEIEIPGKSSRYRSWSDEEGRFVPDFKNTRFVARMRHRARYRAGVMSEAARVRCAERRKDGLAMILGFAETEGRPPFAAELRDRLGLKGNEATVLAHVMGWDRRESYVDFMNSIWEEAGYRRPDGRAMSRR